MLNLRHHDIKIDFWKENGKMQRFAHKKLVIYILLMIFALSLLPAHEVFATRETRERLEELEGARQQARLQERNVRNLLRETHGEIERIMLEMQALDERMMDALEALDDIELSIVQSELRKEYAEIELENAREERDLYFVIFQSRLRAMQEHGPIRYIEVLLQAESILDFLLRIENVRTITQFNQDIIQKLEFYEARYLANVDELARVHSLVLDLQFQQEIAKQNLQNAMDDRTEWLINLANNAAYQVFLISIYEQEQIALNLEFSYLEIRYQEEVDEIERRRAEEAQRRRLARLNNFRGQFVWPIPTHAPGARGFGMQMHPIFGVNQMHTGVDVSAPTGTRINAAAEGYVRFTGWMGGYGNTVIIDHGGGYSTLYAHNSRNRVTEGQHVTAGQHIADVGSSGLSTGPHLHFEVRRNNVAVDPMAFFH